MSKDAISIFEEAALYKKKLRGMDNLATTNYPSLSTTIPWNQYNYQFYIIYGVSNYPSLSTTIPWNQYNY